MAVDLYIHIGKPHEAWVPAELVGYDSRGKEIKAYSGKAFDTATDDARRHPHIRVGEASFLGASQTGDRSKYVPGPIGRIVKLIPDASKSKSVKVTRQLVKDIKRAFSLQNKTDPKYELEDAEKILSFLERHRGKYAYTIAW
jgi:hypothetical protein